MCVDEPYIRKLAADACEWQKLGAKLPGSAGMWGGGGGGGCNLSLNYVWHVGAGDLVFTVLNSSPKHI